MGVFKFFKPFFRFSIPFWGIIMAGIFILMGGGHLGIAMLTNLYAWTWFGGVIVGYIVWDLTRNNRDHSYLLTWWDNRKNPLSFKMHLESLPSGEGIDYVRIGAYVFNSAPKKRKQVCIVARDSRGCKTSGLTNIEYCIDIPTQTNTFVPMFEVMVAKEGSQYRVCGDNLKSPRVPTEWCEMTDPAFMFKPCFSDDMNQEECLRLCTVSLPNEIYDKVFLFEEYYADDEKEQFRVA